ncbi:MAG: Trp family transcriptional regulator [bacterium]|nr:Trp family transcriptional regulator [bacterium]
MKTTNKASKREEEIWEKIVKNPKLLKSLFTHNERLKITSRLAVIEMINSGKNHHEISRELDISRQTISSIKKSLKENEYRSYWERGKTERKKKIYSPIRAPKKKRPEGRAVRTKYGIVYSNI